MLGRDPKKLPRLISGSGSGSAAKYRPETGDTVQEEEEHAEAEEAAAAVAEDGAEADDEAELTDVRREGDGEEVVGAWVDRGGRGGGRVAGGWGVKDEGGR